MTPQELPEKFRHQLEQSGLQFSLPPGFRLIAPQANDSVAYHCAIALSEPKLEIRYQIVSLQPQPLPDGFTPIASVDLNNLYDTYLTALIHNVADRVLTGPNPFPAEAVQKEFNADYGDVSRLGLKPSTFGAGFNECLLLSLHRDDLADVYVFFMFENIGQVAKLIESNFYTMTFARKSKP